MYLYGASVQGIQDFIFKTNKLQEIVGASEIVKGIEKYFEEEYNPIEILRNAGGNIKAIFDENECKRISKNFPKEIMQRAYGITISQAVVKMEGEFKEQNQASKEVERLLRIQRNKPSISLDLSLNILELAPSTSKVVVGYEKIQKKSVPVDRATKQKLKAYKEFIKNKPYLKEFSQLSNFSNGKNKLAVIHADGNSLGELVQNLGKNLSEFSIALNIATQKAFNDAKEDYMDIRDVILGGDDMVVICNANNALEFTKRFLENFEKETSEIEILKEYNVDKLTACAGIAYSNEKYPFHYAVSLAEELCGVTKKHAKKLREKKKLDFVPSSLMFHNIQSSNFHSWDRFVEDELTIRNDKEAIRCDFGPYYLDEQSESLIQDFIHTVEAYRCDGSPISRLRAWIGELSKSSEYARLMLERINTMVEKKGEWHSCIMEKNLKAFNEQLSNEKLIVQKDGVAKTPIYDVLQVLSATEAK